MRKLLFLGVVLCLGMAYAGTPADDPKINGDFRYRHDYIDQEDRSERSRHQIRVRLGIEGEVSSGIKVVLQLATGYDNPVAGNQTLSNAASSKAVAWNLAYFELKDRYLTGLRFAGGKMPNPWYKPGGFELVWDNDLNPEGLSAGYCRGFSRLTISLIGSVFWIEERTDDIDSYLGGSQAVIKYTCPQERVHITFGGAYFSYLNIRGFPTFYKKDKSFNNSIDSLGNYLWDYELVELMAEVDFRIRRIPVRLAADYIFNTTVDSLDAGWLVGVKAGKLKKPGSLMISYTYRNVECDAVVGIFTDNTIGGGTDLKGHEVNVDIQLAQKTAFRISCFNTKIGLADEKSYRRLQFDLRLKF